MGFRSISSLLEEKLDKGRLPEGIIALYLYGSVRQGRLRQDSDVDVAMLPSPVLTDSEKLQLIAQVEALFASALRDIGLPREVSVLEMRGKYVPLELLHQVISQGTLIYERDASERLEFENALQGEYFDFRFAPRSSQAEAPWKSTGKSSKR